MSCFECSIYAKGNHRACKDILILLNKLDIPICEQTILWTMASKKMCCKNFKNLLLYLIKKQEKDIFRQSSHALQSYDITTLNT